MFTHSGCVLLKTVNSGDLPASAYLPRTRSYIFLRDAGVPVLDGCLMLESDEVSLAEARTIMCGFTSVLVRSDPFRNDSPSIRAGDVWPLENLEKCAAQYSAAGRALILFEPYERKENRWSFSLLIDRKARLWFLEIVGAGFDCGHLNRGRVTPHEVFSGNLEDRGFIVNSHTPFDFMRYQLDAKKFGLPCTNATQLPDVIFAKILRSATKLLPLCKETLFVLSGAVLSPGERFVLWDLFDPTQAGR